MKWVEVGRVVKYFQRVEAAAVELSGELKIGDTIAIRGQTTNFQQRIDSMQIEGEPIEKAGKGQAVGIKVIDRVRPNDIVYKRMEEEASIYNSQL
jgi:putative protease